MSYRTKFRLWNITRTIGYFFRPINTIAISTVITALIDIVFVIILILTKSKVFYDIIFALLTGVTASYGVAVMIELSSNFRFNKRREIELSKLYSRLYFFEISRLTFHGIKLDKSMNIVVNNGMDEDGDELEELDDIQILWYELSELISNFRIVYDEKREYLSYNELILLRTILELRLYSMKSILWRFVFPSLSYDMVNNPDIESIDSIFPKTISDNLSDKFKREYANVEFNRKLDKLIDDSFSNKDLLEEAFSDIPIGIQYLTDDNDENSDITDSNLLSDCLKYMLDDIFSLEKECNKIAHIGFEVYSTHKLTEKGIELKNGAKQ